MNRKIKGRKKEIQLSIDEDLEIIFYSFTPLVPKATGGNMNLTPQDIAAIRAAMQPDFLAIENRFIKLEAKVDGIDERLMNLETKVDGIDTRLANLETKVDGIDTRISNIVEKNSLSE